MEKGMDSAMRTVGNDGLLVATRQLLAEGRRVQLTVRGRSMRPMLEHNRDTVVLEAQLPADYQRGDVVLAQTTTQQWVLHRIVSCDDRQCQLQGDGNVAQQETCDRASIAGRVVQFTRKSRTFAVEHWAWRAYRWLWMHTLLLRRPLLIAYELWHRTSCWCSTPTNAH